jgi:exodeoxyribonuclease V alpha subunit
MDTIKRNTVTALLESGEFSSLDRHFALFMERLSGTGDPVCLLVSALLSRALENADTCLPLGAVAGKSFGPITLPELPELEKMLRGLPVVGDGSTATPLVLNGRGRLYLHRYFNYERQLARSIKSLSSSSVTPAQELPSWISPEDQAGRAILNALERRLCIITGGPGTGKTWAVAKIVAALLQRDPRMKIALCAPTGKAAFRLQGAIAEAAASMAPDTRPGSGFPAQSFTLHRLLGPLGYSPLFRHDRDNPLPYDAVIVDEASMVDLALMAKLTDAIKPGARLVLLGDKDQLSSVEAGSVFADLCEANPGGSVVRFTRTFRYSGDSCISGAASLVNQGKGKEALELLKARGAWKAISSGAGFHRDLTGTMAGWLDSLLAGLNPPEAALEILGHGKILCAVRKGPRGSEGINDYFSALVRRRTRRKAAIPWHAGRPVIILENDYERGLFNGDSGVAVPMDPEDPDRLTACFKDAQGNVRKFPVTGLPRHDTAFAITVHKSQGSEFGSVHLVLPDKDSDLLTRELLYTAITRARESITVWGSEEIFIKAAERRSARVSGLKDAIEAD